MSDLPEKCTRCGEPIAEEDRDEINPAMHYACAEEEYAEHKADAGDRAYDAWKDEQALRGERNA